MKQLLEHITADPHMDRDDLLTDENVSRSEVLWLRDKGLDVKEMGCLGQRMKL